MNMYKRCSIPSLGLFDVHTLVTPHGPLITEAVRVALRNTSNAGRLGPGVEKRVEESRGLYVGTKILGSHRISGNG